MLYPYLLLCKVDVNGDNSIPLFEYLRNALPGWITNNIKWNFTKFLIVDGKPYKRYATNISPIQIEDDIIQILKQKKKDEL